MSLGLKIRINQIRSEVNNQIFNLRKYLFGYENACVLLSRLDKISTMKILKNNGAKIGKNCDIESHIQFHNCTNFENLIIGENCHIGKDCFFDLRGKVIIGNNVTISMKCVFITHIDMSNSELSKIYPAQSGEIRVCDNVYIGAGSMILRSVIISENTLVAAGTVLIKHTQKNTVVAGVPGKIIKRF